VVEVYLDGLAATKILTNIRRRCA